MTYEDRRWHVPEEDLRAYARGGLEAPALWSAEEPTVCSTCVTGLLGVHVAGDVSGDVLAGGSGVESRPRRE